MSCPLFELVRDISFPSTIPVLSSGLSEDSLKPLKMRSLASRYFASRSSLVILDFSLAEADSALEIVPSLSASLPLSTPASEVAFDGDSDFDALSFSPSDVGVCFCFSLSAAAALRMIFIAGALGGGVFPVEATGFAMLVKGRGLISSK
jgi:hypothetical protein